MIVHDGHFCTGLYVLKKGYRSRMILWLACGTCGDLGKYLTVASISYTCTRSFNINVARCSSVILATPPSHWCELYEELLPSDPGFTVQNSERHCFVSKHIPVKCSVKSCVISKFDNKV